MILPPPLRIRDDPRIDCIAIPRARTGIEHRIQGTRRRQDRQIGNHRHGHLLQLRAGLRIAPLQRQRLAGRIKGQVVLQCQAQVALARRT